MRDDFKLFVYFRPVLKVPELKITKVCYRLLVEDFSHFMNFPEAALRGALGYFWHCEGPQYDPLYEAFFGKPGGATPPKAGMLYVYPCKNEADKAMLELTLFGEREGLVPYFTKSLQVLGREGIGRVGNRFKVEAMTPPKTALLQDFSGLSSDLSSGALEDVAQGPWLLKVKTPLSVRDVGGSILRQWDSGAFGRNLLQRLVSICENYGVPVRGWNLDSLAEEFGRLVATPDMQYVQRNRTSSRQNKNIDYSGIVGRIRLESVSPRVYMLLRMAEQVSVGKNTVFGGGKIKLAR